MTKWRHIVRRGIAILVISVVSLTVALVGCSSETTETSEETTVAENPYGGFPVDPPAPDEVVLTVTGTSSRDYTMSELEDLATSEITIMEPFAQRTETFRGVPLTDLFSESGLQPEQQVATIALNDYRYADSVDAFVSSDGVLAVSRNGGPIPMDQGGPIRIIFPEGSHYYSFLDAWNWSLRSIEPVTDQ
jgi:hypothetical protein